MSNPVKYSLGFAFIGNQVLLLNKTHPETQKNKYNGLGGKLEENDTIIAQEIGADETLACMVREFREESYVPTAYEQWVKTGTITTPIEQNVVVDTYVTVLQEDQLHCIRNYSDDIRDPELEHLILVNLEELEELNNQGKLVDNVYDILKSSSVIGYFNK